MKKVKMRFLLQRSVKIHKCMTSAKKHKQIGAYSEMPTLLLSCFTPDISAYKKKNALLDSCLGKIHE